MKLWRAESPTSGWVPDVWARAPDHDAAREAARPEIEKYGGGEYDMAEADARDLPHALWATLG